MTRSSTDKLFELDPEIERTFRALRIQEKISEASESSLSSSDTPMVDHSRTMKELAAPDEAFKYSCITYPTLAGDFELRSGLIHLLPKYQGLSGEDPNRHLHEFHVVCSTMKPQGISEEDIKLRAFPFSLIGAVKDWLYYLPRGFITSWIDMKKAFLEKFFPASRTATIRKSICGIQQVVGETLYDYWERSSKFEHYQFQNQNFQQGQNFIQQALPAPSRLSLTQGNSSNTSSSDAQQVRLEELMQQILQQQQSQQRTDSTIQNIERQIGQLASILNQMQAQGSSQLPSQTTPNPKGNVSALTLRSGKRVAEFSIEETAIGKCPEIQQQSSNSEGIQTEQNVPTSGLTQSSIDPLNMEHSQGEGSLIPKFSSNFCPAEHFPAAIPDFSKLGNSGNQNSIQEATGPLIPLPFPQRKTQPRKDVEEERAKEFQELVNLFSKVEINVPLLTMIKQIPKYVKFLKDLCVHKKKLKGNELISMGKNVSALLQPVPQKCEDPSVFTVPCIGPLQPTGVVIQLADRSQTHPAGVIEDVLVKVRELIFPANFYILDMEGDYLASRFPLILGRPFLKTARTKIDVQAGTLSMEIGDTVV
ncbi:uncharacterized protein LOC122029101 [Zingiber officinale]|uniref:uncharacterized protein LOC122029101 n=1 Tax=Zingiber officinale TaxID=94328 RepID=UPI001C4AFF81|nr:uncharacterized protein LOC122029101 [Zingiber officinale]